MPGKSDLATFLEHHREIAGLSVCEIVERMAARGVQTKTRAVASWLSGDRVPRPDSFRVLLAVLHVVRQREIDEACRLRCGIPSRKPRTGNRPAVST